MSTRMIWVVRLIGIIVFLVLMYLLISLHARLVQMNEESPAKPSTSTSGRIGGEPAAPTALDTATISL